MYLHVSCCSYIAWKTNPKLISTMNPAIGGLGLRAYKDKDDGRFLKDATGFHDRKCVWDICLLTAACKMAGERVEQ